MFYTKGHLRSKIIDPFLYLTLFDLIPWSSLLLGPTQNQSSFDNELFLQFSRGIS